MCACVFALKEGVKGGTNKKKKNQKNPSHWWKNKWTLYYISGKVNLNTTSVWNIQFPIAPVVNCVFLVMYNIKRTIFKSNWIDIHFSDDDMA